MAAAYTHYRFGQTVLAGLPEAYQELITEALPYFHLGLQGPDILFFYQFYRANPIARQGYALHDVSGCEFFSRMADILDSKKDSEDYRGALSYVYGCLCHFALDSTVHAYIDAYAEQHPVDHLGIETEFDRMMMARDGRSPVFTSKTGSLLADERIAAACHDFYSEVDEREFLSAIRNMKFVDRMMMADNPVKRLMVRAVLRAAGFHDKYSGLMMTYRPNPHCRESNHTLIQLYKQALPLARALVLDFCTFAQGDHVHPQYRFDFNGIEHEIWERKSDDVF